MNKYKTFEELKKELGDKFEEFMYKSNIELLNKIDKAIEYIENHKYKYWNGLGEIGIEDREFEKDTNPEELLEILKGKDE